MKGNDAYDLCRSSHASLHANICMCLREGIEKSNYAYEQHHPSIFSVCNCYNRWTEPSIISTLLAMPSSVAAWVQVPTNKGVIWFPMQTIIRHDAGRIRCRSCCWSGSYGARLSEAVHFHDPGAVVRLVVDEYSANLVGVRLRSPPREPQHNRTRC